MKKDSKQRLFEIVARLDESFVPRINEIKNDISDVVSQDIIKLIFNPQELEILRKGVDDDLSRFNSNNPDSEYYDPFAVYTNESLKHEIQNLLKNRGVVINEETIKFLTNEVQTYFM